MNLSACFPDDEIELSRVVRAGILFDSGDGPQGSGADPARGAGNGFAGIPPSDGRTAHHELDVVLRGRPDPVTGYLVGIQEVDAIARRHAIPELSSMLHASEPGAPAAIVGRLAACLGAQLPAGAALVRLRWSPGPFIHYDWNVSMPDHAVLVERFEFSAAHRLHCPSLSDEENRRVFGKCNHASGHGHNYKIAVGVRVGSGADADARPTEALESIVARCVLARFDHRHLNVDCPEFAALNPSVENIVRVCHGLLAGPLAEAGMPLDHVTVWETEKTSATYPARGG